MTTVLIKSWDQSIIIVEQTPKLKSEVTITNTSSESLKYFQINLTEEQVQRLAQISAIDNFGNILKAEVEDDSVSITIGDSDINFRYVTFTLKDDLLP